MNLNKKYHHEDWVSKKAVCEALDIDTKTLTNYISKGKVPVWAIRQGLVKMYHLPTLKGLTNAYEIK